MAHIVFYEKPGCIGNARQKKLLERSGHQLDVRDMTTTPWTPDLLRPFFGKRPVTQWFNLSSPRVKSGEVKADTLSADQALDVLCADPLLIRRPLLKVGDEYEVGFEMDLIDAWIGLHDDEAEVGEGCPRETLKASSRTKTS
ncbi:MAG: ArsC/Spx/MgsR family protein [Pseudomonadota bacterium]